MQDVAWGLTMCGWPPSISLLQRLRMMVKPVVLLRGKVTGQETPTAADTQSQNPANEEAYI